MLPMPLAQCLMRCCGLPVSFSKSQKETQDWSKPISRTSNSVFDNTGRYSCPAKHLEVGKMAGCTISPLAFTMTLGLIIHDAWRGTAEEWSPAFSSHFVHGWHDNSNNNQHMCQTPVEQTPGKHQIDMNRHHWKWSVKEAVWVMWNHHATNMVAWMRVYCDKCQKHPMSPGCTTLVVSLQLTEELHCHNRALVETLNTSPTFNLLKNCANYFRHCNI